MRVPPVRVRGPGDRPPVWEGLPAAGGRAAWQLEPPAGHAAIRRGLLTENPAAKAELPRARRPRAVVWTPYRIEEWRRTGERPAVAVWTARQTAQFLASIDGHRLYAAYHLITLRGLRRGEAAGLRWCDIDLDGKTAVISQQLQQYDGRLAICPPKTAHSTRVIALDHTTVAALRGHPTASAPRLPPTGPATGPAGSCSPTSMETRWRRTG